MDSSLAAFLEKGLEFIVGGAIFLASCFFLLYSLAWEPATSIGAQAKVLSNGLVVTLFLVSAYAAGVIVESLCRFLFEWDLKRITVRRSEFLSPEDVHAVASPASFTELALGRVTPEATDSGARVSHGSALERGEADASAGEASSPASPKVESPLPALARLTAKRVGQLFRASESAVGVGGESESLGYYSRDSCRQAERERERQRLAVAMSSHDGLQSDIDSQLKRLRLERITTLSLALVLVGFIIRGETVPALVSLGLLGVMISIVHGRFRRFCSAIARGYQLIGSSQQARP